MPDDEAELIVRAQRGDRHALCVLLEVHGPEIRKKLEGRISLRWRSKLDSDDVMQVTYMEAFVRIGQFKHEGPGTFLAWLKQIAENNLHDAIRELKAAKRPDPALQVQQPIGEDSVLAFYELMGGSTTSPSRKAVRQEAETHLLRAIKTLPDDYRNVVQKYDLEGEPIEVLAAQMNRSIGAIYMLRARAHRRLREMIGPESKRS